MRQHRYHQLSLHVCIHVRPIEPVVSRALISLLQQAYIIIHVISLHVGALRMMTDDKNFTSQVVEKRQVCLE